MTQANQCAVNRRIGRGLGCGSIVDAVAVVGHNTVNVGALGKGISVTGGNHPAGQFHIRPVRIADLHAVSRIGVQIADTNQQVAAGKRNVARQPQTSALDLGLVNDVGVTTVGGVVGLEPIAGST